MNKKQKLAIISLILTLILLTVILILVVLQLTKVVRISLYWWLWLTTGFYCTAITFYFSLKC